MPSTIPSDVLTPEQQIDALWRVLHERNDYAAATEKDGVTTLSLWDADTISDESAGMTAAFTGTRAECLTQYIAWAVERRLA